MSSVSVCLSVRFACLSARIILYQEPVCTSEMYTCSLWRCGRGSVLLQAAQWRRQTTQLGSSFESQYAPWTEGRVSIFLNKIWKTFDVILFDNSLIHLVIHLVWPHGGPISMRPRALRTMQDP